MDHVVSGPEPRSRAYSHVQLPPVLLNLDKHWSGTDGHREREREREKPPKKGWAEYKQARLPG